MPEHKPLYLWSLEDAVRHNERDEWRESYRENCDCARAIERAIEENYHDNRLEDGSQRRLSHETGREPSALLLRKGYFFTRPALRL